MSIVGFVLHLVAKQISEQVNGLASDQPTASRSVRPTWGRH